MQILNFIIKKKTVFHFQQFMVNTVVAYWVNRKTWQNNIKKMEEYKELTNLSKLQWLAATGHTGA